MPMVQSARLPTRLVNLAYSRRKRLFFHCAHWWEATGCSGGRSPWIQTLGQDQSMRARWNTVNSDNQNSCGKRKRVARCFRWTEIRPESPGPGASYGNDSAGLGRTM